MNDDLVAAPSGGIPDSARNGWLEELRATFTLAWPLVIAQLAQNALATTDVIMLGWLGPAHLAAGTLATTFMMPFQVGAVGIIGAVAPLVAQARGSRSIKSVRHIVRQGLWASVILAFAILPILLQIKPIFGLLGQDPLTTEMAADFIDIAAFLLFPALALIALRSFLSAFDATRIILVITLAGVLFNAVANYGLIFGNWGLPRLELQGAALATVLTNVLMVSAMLAFVLRQTRFRRFHVLRNFMTPDWPRLREIFRIGTPIGLTVLSEVGLFTAAAMLMGQIGTDEVAAHAIAVQCASMAFMVPLGLGIAATIRVGMAYGRGDAEAVRKAGWTAFVLGTGFMALTCLLFLTAGPHIAALFLDPAKAGNTVPIGLAAGFLVIAGVFQLVDGAQVVAAHALRGMSDTKFPMLVAIFGYWAVGLPTAYVLGFIVGWRGVGIWIGLAVGLAVVASVLVTRFAMRERLGLLRPSMPS